VRLTSRLAIPAASAVLILALSACGSSDDSHSTMSGAGTTSSSMAEGMTTTATSGDVEFAQMMIPHHEQAVEMADVALENDTASQDVKALAAQIKAAQDPEWIEWLGLNGMTNEYVWTAEELAQVLQTTYLKAQELSK